MLSGTRAEGAGTFVAKTRYGYAILVNTVGKAIGDPCSFDGTHLYDVGVSDWMGADYCWNYQGNPWVYGSVQHSCNPWTPGSSCDYFYYTFPYSRYGGGGIVSVDGYFYQSCTFGQPCDDVLNENIDHYGNYWADYWAF